MRPYYLGYAVKAVPSGLAKVLSGRDKMNSKPNLSDPRDLSGLLERTTKSDEPRFQLGKAPEHLSFKATPQIPPHYLTSTHYVDQRLAHQFGAVITRL